MNKARKGKFWIVMLIKMVAKIRIFKIFCRDKKKKFSMMMFSSLLRNKFSKNMTCIFYIRKSTHNRINTGAKLGIKKMFSHIFCNLFPDPQTIRTIHFYTSKILLCTRIEDLNGFFIMKSRYIFTNMMRKITESRERVSNIYKKVRKSSMRHPSDPQQNFFIYKKICKNTRLSIKNYLIFTPNKDS